MTSADMQGKICLVTGSTRGLGKAVALSLAAEGAHVAICARGEEALRKTAAELPGPAYAMGFLRTYAQFLGLDGNALVDEYRRTAGTSVGGEHPYSFGEPLLERRLRPGEEPRRRRGVGVTALAVDGISAEAATTASTTDIAYRFIFISPASSCHPACHRTWMPRKLPALSVFPRFRSAKPGTIVPRATRR